MIRVALVGTGKMGTYHARLAAAHDTIEIVAYVDINTPSDELMALAPQAIHATDLAQVIDLCDAVIIASPTPTHYAIACIALAAQKHVLIEKPITLDAAQARDLFAQAHAYNGVVQVGHVERYNPAFVTAQSLIDGPIRMIRSTRSGPYHPRVGNDSVVMDLMIHDIDLMLLLLHAPPTTVQALASSHKSMQPDTALAQLAWSTGTVATVAAHRGAMTSRREMIIETDTQQLYVDFGARTVQITDAKGERTMPADNSNPLNEQLCDFVNAIQAGVGAVRAAHDMDTVATTLMIAEKAAATAHPLPRTRHAVQSRA